MQSSSLPVITRISDTSYLIEGKNVGIATIDESIGTPEVRAFLIQVCSPQLASDNENKLITIGGRKFRWNPIKVKKTMMAKIHSAVDNFFFVPSKKGILKYELEEIKPGRFSSVDSKQIHSQTELMNTAKLMTEGLEKKDLDKGIRGKAALEKFNLNASRFSDPYTSLSTLAFQRYESDFTNKDKIENPFSSSLTCLIEEGGELKLQYIKHVSNYAHRMVVEHYYENLKMMYGKEKISYIEHLYNFNFLEMIKRNEPLTPEHVYRMNMGLTNLESHDLNDFYKRLQDFTTKASKLNPESLLENIFQDESILYGNEKSSIFKNLSMINDQPTVKDYLAWAKKLTHFQTFSELNTEQVATLVSLFSVSGRERDQAFTGRKIFGNILGWYNSQELKNYKPWLDQQQLIQAIADYEASSEWKVFYEMLAFTIVKMHLIREHPVDGYRIGALIPAPKALNGQQQWYKVTSCVSNGQGIFSYTLEGLGADTTLPPIKLYRSTAASPYCMHGQASVKNDMNPINSPGYLGRGWGNIYEEAFFNDRSIPVWVGYALDAKEKLAKENDSLIDLATMKSIVESLKNANKEIQINEVRPYQTKNMRQLIRKHDAILIDILSVKGRVVTSSQFEKLLDRLKNKYILINTTDLKEQKKDAKELLEKLGRFANQNLKPHQQVALIDFMSELEEHILKEGKSLQTNGNEAIQNLKSKGYNELESYAKQCSKLIEESKSLEAFELAKKWQQKLEAKALETNEHPSQKKHQSIQIIGHSLGGSCAQLHAYDYIFGRNRIPIPGQNLDLYAFDSPGINKDDNQAFKEFGNKHSSLIKNLSAKIAVHISQEAGDPIAFGGEEHLGATFEQREAEKVEQWLEFVGEVYERLNDAVSKYVAESGSAHGTLYQLGIENIDYKKTFYPSIYQGIIDSGGEVNSQFMKGIADSMRNKMWKNYFSSPTTEKIRGATINTILYFLVNDKELKLKGEEYFDHHGVLAVDESGIISKN